MGFEPLHPISSLIYNQLAYHEAYKTSQDYRLW